MDGIKHMEIYPKNLKRLGLVTLQLITKYIIHILSLFSVVVCFQTVESLAEKIVFLIFYHFILALFVWSYFKTIFAPKCETPSKWKLSPGKNKFLFIMTSSFAIFI